VFQCKKELIDDLLFNNVYFMYS